MRISKILFPVMLIATFGSVLYLVIEKGAFSMNQSDSDLMDSKPLIDTQVPKGVATATFAMG